MRHWLEPVLYREHLLLGIPRLKRPKCPTPCTRACRGRRANLSTPVRNATRTARCFLPAPHLHAPGLQVLGFQMLGLQVLGLQAPVLQMSLLQVPQVLAAEPARLL